MPKLKRNMSTSPKERQPVLMSPDDKEQLLLIAEKENRSAQAMAGIIYRMGLDAYLNRNADKQ
jgi:hypothetical protein